MSMKKNERGAGLLQAKKKAEALAPALCHPLFVVTVNHDLRVEAVGRMGTGEQPDPPLKLTADSLQPHPA